MLLARIPPTAVGVTMTLHVAVTLDRGYGAAGLASAVITVGIGIGSPLMGRLIDRRGLRTMLLLSVTSMTLFFLLAPLMTYVVLLVAGFVAGVLCVPAMSLGRQAITALVPVHQRRTAMSLDSISVELSFMVGPALGVLVATKLSTSWALAVIGLATLASGALLYAVNPVLVHEDDDVEGPHPSKREWVTGPLLATLAVAAGAVFALSAMEVAIVASLERVGEASWIGVVFVVMCASSAIGGLIYGSIKRPPGQITLMALLALFAIPVGLGDGNWLVLSLALIPMNVMCAPTIAATAEKITGLVPPTVRGEALGLHGSAFTFGSAIGLPLAGVAIDHSGPPLGFVVAGAGGLLLAALAVVLTRRSGRLGEVLGGVRESEAGA
ncbi:MFS transporter [Lentzea sp. NBRC 105346]|nr:MFS transporter [Lentzea sp. NBRC 105346]